MRVIRSLLATFLLGAAVLHGEGTPSRFAEEHLEASALLQSALWTEAIAAYRSLLERGPDDSLVRSAQLGLAQSLAGGGKHADAVDVLQELRQMSNRPAQGQGAGADWRFAAHREVGRVLQAQGKWAQAIETYGTAIDATGKEPALADDRARVRLEVAQCLARSEKRLEAIELLTESLDELSAPEFAGMRALQKASLARHYMEVGERDWAVTILEEIRRDPQLDPQHFAVAEAMARGESWKPVVTGKLRTREGPGYLAIEAEGRFELRIATPPVRPPGDGADRSGEIVGWFNLADDPLKTTNLLGPTGSADVPVRDSSLRRTHGRPWVAFGHGADGDPTPPQGFGGQAVRGPSGAFFKVIEESSLRIRTRMSNAAWPQEVIEYTFYSSGHIFVAASCERERERPAVRIGGVDCILRPSDRVNWRVVCEAGARMSGEGALRGESRYLLAHSNAIPTPRRVVADDLLMCFSAPQPQQIFIVDGASREVPGAEMRLSCEEKTVRVVLAGQILVYPRTIDSAGAALPYVDDYQFPASMEVSAGSVVRDDPGDLNGDGYNESEGCYVVGGTGRVVLDAGEHVRHAPAIKFLAVDIQGIPDLEVNGRMAGRESYNLVRMGKESFLLQWLGVVPAHAHMEFTLK